VGGVCWGGLQIKREVRGDREHGAGRGTAASSEMDSLQRQLTHVQHKQQQLHAALSPGVATGLPPGASSGAGAERKQRIESLLSLKSAPSPWPFPPAPCLAAFLSRPPPLKHTGALRCAHSCPCALILSCPVLPWPAGLSSRRSWKLPLAMCLEEQQRSAHVSTCQGIGPWSMGHGQWDGAWASGIGHRL